MNALTAVNAAMSITNAALTLLQQAQAISALVAKAQSENRDLTQEEVDSIIAQDDAAKIALHAAILSKGS